MNWNKMKLGITKQQTDNERRIQGSPPKPQHNYVRSYGTVAERQKDQFHVLKICVVNGDWFVYALMSSSFHKKIPLFFESVNTNDLGIIRIFWRPFSNAQMWAILDIYNKIMYRYYIRYIVIYIIYIESNTEKANNFLQMLKCLLYMLLEVT